MVTVSPVRSEEDYETALARIDELMNAEPNTPEDDELDILVGMVERYEEGHHPIGPPDPIAAIEFRMDQAGLTRRDLAPYIGSRAKVSEVLSGKRAITMAMARALHRHLGIPAEALLQDPRVLTDDTLADVEWGRFPLKEMARLGWTTELPDLKDRAEEVMRGLIDRAGGPKVAAASMFRKNDHRRINAKTDEYALSAWCWKVLANANERPPGVPYRKGTVTPELLRDIARMSSTQQGPVKAVQALAGVGIAVETVRHLRRTHLDGAALRLSDGRPVIGLTLRYDRIDNFWYTLLHELAHVGRHMDCNGEDSGFVDDHSLRRAETGSDDSMEAAADRWAEDALIPPKMWSESAAYFKPTPTAVVDLAMEAGVHPAIVAGRVRYEENNYRLLSQFVGTGRVRKLFK